MLQAKKIFFHLLVHVVAHFVSQHLPQYYPVKSCGIKVIYLTMMNQTTLFAHFLIGGPKWLINKHELFFNECVSLCNQQRWMQFSSHLKLRHAFQKYRLILKERYGAAAIKTQQNLPVSNYDVVLKL